MPNYISKVTLPSGGTYDIHDAHAWDATENGSLQKQINDLADTIAGGVTFIIAWDGSSAPTVANIPAGVKVYYNSTEYTGTMAATSAQTGAFYMVRSSTQEGINDHYDEYTVITEGSSKVWEKIGDTQAVIGGTTNVLGTSATFTGSASGTAVGSTTKYMKATASGAAVASTTKYLSASASGTAVGANGTATAVTGYSSPTSDTFVTGVSGTSRNLVTTTVPNVTDVGSASTWSFTMGTGAGNTETLIISGSNSVAPTLGTAKTVATGSYSTTGTGSSVITSVGSSGTASALTGLGTPSTSTVLTGVKVTTQPTITLNSGDSSATGRITYLESLGTVTQPTISLSAESSSATGRAQYVQSLGTVTQPTITVSINNADSKTVLTPAT